MAKERYARFVLLAGTTAAALLAAAGCGGQDGGAGQGGAAAQSASSMAVEGGVQQAPALPGAPAVSPTDRVYTADQSSNTVSVIDPSANSGAGEVLGTIALGTTRLEKTLGPVDQGEVNVHGLGFSRDGRMVNATDVTSNAVQLIDTATNTVTSSAHVGRSPHEGFVSPDGTQVWTAVRGEDYVVATDVTTGEVVDEIQTAKGPSKVVFSPDGSRAYVNHFFANELSVIDTTSHEVIERVEIPPEAGSSADEAISPDGAEVWLGHPATGKTTVVNVADLAVETVLDTGPRTNHPNFVTTAEGELAYVTVGGMNQTLVYRRSEDAAPPEPVAQIKNSGASPHGIWRARTARESTWRSRSPTPWTSSTPRPTRSSTPSGSARTRRPSSTWPGRPRRAAGART